MFTASQVISALIQKMGAKSVTLTYGEVMSFGTKHPTRVEVSERAVILKKRPWRQRFKNHYRHLRRSVGVYEALRGAWLMAR